MVYTTTQTMGYAALQENAPMTPFTFERRRVRASDVKIEILYCGVCHSDLHQVKNEWKKTLYPIVPGHEIVGRVVETGSAVHSFKVGENVAVGCMVDSCQTCGSCKEHLEQYCENGATFTYNSKDKIDGNVTYGGYSSQIVVDEKFVLHLPKAFKEVDFPRVAPLLCAGITTYSPLKHWKVGNGTKVGVVGIGGLGHMAIKLAAALGAHVVVFTTSKSKMEDAKRLGAHEVVISTNVEGMKKHNRSLNFILNTASAAYNLDTYMELLKRDGSMCLLGVPDQPYPTPSIRNFIFKRAKLGGSLIGGIQETQEMLAFCAEHHVLADIELIPIQKIDEAYKRMLKGDVKYRFVIDCASLKK